MEFKIIDYDNGITVIEVKITYDCNSKNNIYEVRKIMPFTEGNSGNPLGRPKGSLNISTKGLESF